MSCIINQHQVFGKYPKNQTLPDTNLTHHPYHCRHNTQRLFSPLLFLTSFLPFVLLSQYFQTVVNCNRKSLLRWKAPHWKSMSNLGLMCYCRVTVSYFCEAEKNWLKFYVFLDILGSFCQNQSSETNILQLNTYFPSYIYRIFDMSSILYIPLSKNSWFKELSDPIFSWVKLCSVFFIKISIQYLMFHF